LVAKKKRKKGSLFKGEKPHKKEGNLGKATKQRGKKRKNEDQSGIARST
jgi:hypothetical protein